MLIGVLKEIKDNEYRVAITPAGVTAFIKAHHRVVIEDNAGIGSGFTNEQYQKAGAEIIEDRQKLCSRAELVLKIKEPLPDEYSLFKPGQMLFTFFHFASNRDLTEAMLRTQVTCIAYETVQTADGKLPLLAPMSEVAGKMAPLIAANYLAKPLGGKGVLASSVAHVAPAGFLILGGGNAGQAAARIALGIGADITLIEKCQNHINILQKEFPGISCLPSTPENIARALPKADAVIGTVHIPGTRAPRLVSRDMLTTMEQGSVIVDIAIDQGGCFETSKPTTHSEPVYREEGIMHYCVANMPGIFPRTSTLALVNAALPYALELADKGRNAFNNPELLKGLNLYKGHVTNRGVAEACNLPCADPQSVLGE